MVMVMDRFRILIQKKSKLRFRRIRNSEFRILAQNKSQLRFRKKSEFRFRRNQNDVMM